MEFQNKNNERSDDVPEGSTCDAEQSETSEGVWYCDIAEMKTNSVVTLDKGVTILCFT